MNAVTERVRKGLTTIIEETKVWLYQLPEGPEREKVAQLLEQMERIAGKKLQ